METTMSAVSGMGRITGCLLCKLPDVSSGQMLPGAKGQQALEHLSHQRG